MTQAVHSGSIVDGGRIVYLGGAAGFVLRAPDMPTIYFAGDTGLFGDMKIIGEIYKPRDRVPADRRSLHDGTGHGRDRRAVARRAAGRADALGHVSGADRNAAALKEHLAGTGIEVLELKPGETAK